MQRNNYPIFIKEIFDKIDFFLSRDEYKIALFYYVDLFNCLKNYIYIISISLSEKDALDLDEEFKILKNTFNTSIDKYKLIKMEKLFNQIYSYYTKDNAFFIKNKILNQIQNEINFLENDLKELLSTKLILTIKKSKIKEKIYYLILNNKIKLKTTKNPNLIERAFYIKLNRKFLLVKTNKLFSDDINKSYYPDKKEYIAGNLYNAFIEYLTEGNPFYLKKNIVTEKKYFSKQKIEDKDEIINLNFSDVYNSINDLLKKDSGYLIINGPKGIGKTTFINNLNIKDVNIKIFKFKENNSIKDLELFIKDMNDKSKTIYIFDDIDKLDNFISFISQIDNVSNNYFIFITLNIDLIEISKLRKNIDYINFPYLDINNLKLLIHKISNEKSLLFNTEDHIKILSESNGIIYYAKLIVYKILNYNKIYDKEIKKIQEEIFSIIKYVNDTSFELFLSLLLINKDGLHISELQQLINPNEQEKIELFLKNFEDYIIKANGRYKLSSLIIADILKILLNKDIIKESHHKMINFYEPWDKKVYSSTIKNLPYHYLETNQIAKIKELLKSNFLKSKLKIYPFELLDDLKSLIRYFVKNNEFVDFINFSFLYQNIKEDVKKEILNINSYIKNKDYIKINNLLEYINLPNNKIYFILIVSILSYEEGFIDYSKNLLKNITILDETINKELLFTLISYIGSKGLLDIITFPKTIDEAILFIKNIQEFEYTDQLLYLTLKMTNNILSEIEKGTLIEQLIIKVSEFKDINFIENFFMEVLNYIEKINDENIKASLYYTHIMALMKFPQLYSKFLPILLDIKNKL
ncbi:MAG: hypothetical protein KatS3mg068_1981 [Candidatus Sericytochromatia bacterium]|nr:MAG: hypothetical protein KatS3mg068_1981 [Candidatus Sericytochromatia bacterium]